MTSASWWGCCFEDYNHYSWFPWLVLLFQVNKLLCNPVLKLCVCMSKTSLNPRGSTTDQVCCLNDGSDHSTSWKHSKLCIINMKTTCMLIPPQWKLCVVYNLLPPSVGQIGNSCLKTRHWTHAAHHFSETFTASVVHSVIGLFLLPPLRSVVTLSPRSIYQSQILQVVLLKKLRGL